MEPSGDHAADPGSSSCPWAEPDMPNLPANAPPAPKTCTRSLPVSATAIMPGAGTSGGTGGAKAMALGPEK